MISHRIICLVLGLVLGHIQTGYLYGKAKGIDIRTKGSGNAGATNTLRVLGTKSALIVLLGDIFKCVLAVYISRLLFGNNEPQYEYLYCLYAATGVILGHNFPVYLHFKGGKGIAASAGLIFSFHPAYIPFAVILFFAIYFTTHTVSLGSLACYTVFFVQTIIMGEMGVFHCQRGTLIEMYIITFLLTLMAYYRHRANIGRLLKNEENKVYLSKSKKF